VGSSATITGSIIADNVHFIGHPTVNTTSDQLYFQPNSGGSISNCTFKNLDVYIAAGATPTLQGSTFDNSPITVLGSPTLQNLTVSNTDYLLRFLDEANPIVANLLHSNVTNAGISIQGTVKNDYTLKNYSFPYFLTNTLTVRDGATLTLASGDTIYYRTTSDIYVGSSATITGSIIADNVHFIGHPTVNTTSDQLYFQPNSGGSISNCTFKNLDVYIAAGATPTLQGSTFDNSPITVLGSPTLQNLTVSNTDYLLRFLDEANPVISGLLYSNITNLGYSIQGTVKNDYTLKNYSLPYFLTNTLTVRDGATLTLASGDTIYYRTANDIYVGSSATITGSIIADNVHFIGHPTVNTTSDQLYFQPNSGGSISNCTFKNLDVYIAAGATPTLQGSTFDNSPITVLGSPTLQNLTISNTDYLLRFMDEANPIVANLLYSNVINTGISIQGTVKNDYTLKNYSLPYFLTNTLTVRDGATLTLASGDTIYYRTTSDINVGSSATITGSIIGDNVHFIGHPTVNTTSDQLYFQPNSGGSISNCTFKNLDVYIAAGATPALQGSTFDNSPITVLGSPTLQNLTISNTDYLLRFMNEANPVISGLLYSNITNLGYSIQGNVNNDYSLKNFGVPYFLVNPLYVGNGAKLTLASGDTIYFKSSYAIQVGISSTNKGSLLADNVHFIGDPNPSLKFDRLYFNDGSDGLISNCAFLNLDVFLKNASPGFQSSIFDNSPITIGGSPVLNNLTFKNMDYLYTFQDKATPVLGNINFENIKIQGINYSGTVDADYVLPQLNHPYYFTSGVLVNKGATFTIQPRTEIIFSTFANIWVGNSTSSKGSLIADSVIFNSASSIVTLNFRYGSSGSISNCKFNRISIVADASSPSISSSIFRRTNIAVDIKNGAKPSINEVMFLNNNIAVKNAGADTIDAKNNFWGHYSGPTHIDNPMGMGEIATGNINFIPFNTTLLAGNYNTELLTNELVFGALSVGESNKRQIKIANNGTKDIMISMVTFSNPSFRISNKIPFWIEPSDTVEIEFIYKPVFGGVFSDSAYFHTGDIANPVLAVSLKAEGVDIATISHTKLDFGDVYLKKYDSKFIWFKNLTQNAVRIDSIVSSNSVFRIVKSNLPPHEILQKSLDLEADEIAMKSVNYFPPTSLWANDSLILEVIFRPREFRTYSDSIRIHYQGAGVKKVFVDGTGMADSLNIEIQSIDYKNFPFVYLHVKVDSLGQGIDFLRTPNFRAEENGVPQTEKFSVIPPGQSGGARLADIVFVMDNSGSMSDEQAAVRQNVNSFVTSLNNSGINFALGLCRYGAGINGGKPVFEDEGVLTTDAEYFKNNVWLRNTIDGGHEPGYRSILESVNSVSFRPGSQKIIIIITDETPDQDEITMEQALVACENSSVALFALTNDNLFDFFRSITDATNGEVYDIKSPFNEILDYISAAVSSTYIVQYESETKNWGSDGILAEVFVNNNNFTDSDTIRYYPGGAPVIQLTTNTLELMKQAWNPGSTIKISVSITDNYEPTLRIAYLYYRTSGTVSYHKLQLTLEGGNVYSASIPVDSIKKPGVDFYFQATDGQSTITKPSVNPLSNPFQIAILPNVAPAVTLNPIPYYIQGNPIEFVATITDNTNKVDTAILFYRKVGQLLYQSMAFVQQQGSEYKAIIPAEFADLATIEFYIKVTDDFGVSTHVGFPDNPNSIKEFASVSIKDAKAFDFELSVFPNPALKGGLVNLQFGHKFLGEEIEVALYDLQSRKISSLFSGKVGSTNETMSLIIPENISAGFYNIKVTGHTLNSELIIKLIVGH
jgi:hypothetical protein